MDLVPILTRAESLFRRFERTVQAIDKNNFPVPFPGPSGAGTGIGIAPKSADGTDTRVVSSELCMLLHRDIPWSRTQQSGSS